MTSTVRKLPSSTYRLQLHHAFTFADAEQHLDYFHELGISHLYLSPITEAAPGSMHGYNVVDPTRVNPELGGEEGFRSLAQAARRRGTGIILDIVPNHMSTHERNARWMDVLRLGQDSAYAHWFDIDWQARDEVTTRGKVLLPVLGDELDAVLGRGELSIEVGDGQGFLRYFGRRFPLAPATFEQEQDIRAVLDAQHYVLEYWRAAKAHVNYRRFFTIDELIGVRVEDIDVFYGTHELFARLQQEGLIDGVRVDHADGLSDPAEYFRRLRAFLGDEVYIVAEKILAPGEGLPDDWPIDGTTGYEVMDLINSVFVDGRNEEAFKSIYATTTGRSTDFEALAYACRTRVLDGPLRGPFERAARQLYHSLAMPSVEQTAFTSALHALMASIPVYRTYHSEDVLDPAAEQVIEEARTTAQQYAPGLDPAAVGVVSALLAEPPAESRIAVMRLQQLMPAVQAKALEDNAFYRYVPLLSLSEVGSEPTVFGRSPAEYHARTLARAARWPASMLATATHDHKRGEDTRARLNALSELPQAWAAFLGQHRTAFVTTEPSPLDVYVLYQTMLALWAPSESAEEVTAIAERLAQYLTKAAREAGEHTNWDTPHEAYEAALEGFAGTAATAMSTGRMPSAAELVARLRRLGQVNSLGQVLLKSMSPGVPDTYQGTELWDLSLVDPDNRRPVDYEQRTALLHELAPLLEESPAGVEARRERVPALLQHADDGAIKLYVLARALRRRRILHPLCIEGAYVPIAVRGALADHVIAFARRDADDRWLVVIVTRLAVSLTDGLGDAIDWQDTAIVLPEEFAGPVRNTLTEDKAVASIYPGSAILPAGRVLGTLPVAILEPVAES